MKRTLLALLIFGSLFASCNKEPQPLTKEEIKHKVDSLTNIRIRESDARSQRDLEHRIEIEVKVKVDSIINAQLHAKDTVDKSKIKVQGSMPRVLGNI